MCHCLPCAAFWESPLYWVVAESLLLVCVCLRAELGGWSGDEADMPHPHGHLVWEGPDTSNSEDCGVQGDLQNAARGLREPTQVGGQAQH